MFQPARPFHVELLGLGLLLSVLASFAAASEAKKESQWESFIPPAELTTILAETQISGATTARVTVTFNNSIGYRVQDWGTVWREGNTFYVDAQPEKDLSWPDCFCHYELPHDYDLGVLEAGAYTFVFEAWGHFVKSQAFDVAEGGAEQWVPYVPTAEQTTVSRQTQEAGTTVKVTLTFPTSGYRVLDWGSVQGSVNDFYVEAQLEAWTGPRQADTTTFSHDYDLGALELGEYTFSFFVAEEPVEKFVRSLDFVITAGALPVYRFWAPSNNAHFYTISEDEKDILVAYYPGYWTFEGIAFYAFPEGQQPADSIPVYRFWSPVGQEHFYTISEQERDWLVANHSYYWTLEGVAFYVYSDDQATGSEPVYRFWSPVNNLHFYTVSGEEADYLIANYSYFWTYEGIAWYALTFDSVGD
jgi:hypothetical protein